VAEVGMTGNGAMVGGDRFPDADPAAYGGDELRAQGATVPPGPHSLD